MSEIRSWSDTPAAILANRGWRPSDAAAEKAAEWRAQRAAFESAVARDPQWSETRRLQQELAERGWPGQVIEIRGPLVPAELVPLYTARQMSEAKQGTFGPSGGDEGFVELEREAYAKLEAARARLEAMNAHRLPLPPGSPR